MKHISIVLLAALSAFTLGMRYSSKATTPATAGTLPTIATLSSRQRHARRCGIRFNCYWHKFFHDRGYQLRRAWPKLQPGECDATYRNVSAADIANAGTVAVTVTNPAIAGTGAYGSGGTLAESSGPMHFTIN